jgi:surface antigen
MKKQSLPLIVLTAFVCTLVLSAPVYGQNTDEAVYKGFTEGYCTYYAATQFDSVAPSPKLNWHGDAGDWLENAASAGWATSVNAHDAEVNALIIWTDGRYGHVGVVSRVDRDMITVNEMNWGKVIISKDAITENFNKVTSTRLPISNLNRGKTYTFTGYIFPRLKSGTLRSSSPQSKGRPVIFNDSDWESFWFGFKEAVRKRDRMTLQRMMAQTFQFYADMAEPEQALKYFDSWDAGKNWSILDQLLLVEARPYNSPNPQDKGPSRIAIVGGGRSPDGAVIIFNYGNEGHWRWVQFGPIH